MLKDYCTQLVKSIEKGDIEESQKIFEYIKGQLLQLDNTYILRFKFIDFYNEEKNEVKGSRKKVEKEKEELEDDEGEGKRDEEEGDEEEEEEDEEEEEEDKEDEEEKEEEDSEENENKTEKRIKKLKKKNNQNVSSSHSVSDSKSGNTVKRKAKVSRFKYENEEMEESEEAEKNEENWVINEEIKRLPKKFNDIITFSSNSSENQEIDQEKEEESTEKCQRGEDRRLTINQRRKKTTPTQLNKPEIDTTLENTPKAKKKRTIFQEKDKKIIIEK